MNNKIILVSNTSWFLYNFRLGVIRALQKSGYEIIAVAAKDDYTERLIQQGCVFIPLAIEGQGKNLMKEIKVILALFTIYRRVRPILIFHYTIKPNIYGSISAFFSKSKSIAVVSGAGYVFLKDKLSNKIIKKIYKSSLIFSHSIWFVNNEDKELFLRNKIVSKKKVNVLPGEGIDTMYFSRTVPYPVENQSFKFLLSARLLWDKGVGVYVEAARMIQSHYENVEFLLLGFLDVDNPSAISRNAIEKWVNEGTIKYLGTTDKVIDFLEQVHCFVLPSYYREGAPRALLEAASMELPIITTDNVGCRDVVDDDITGYLCKIKDPEDLALKMSMMLELSREKRELMGKRGRQKIIDEFDEHFVIRKYLQVLPDFSSR